ncbi:MAG: CRISPR system precrRNA processing endoribonuclease RAMP protein Cas6 [Clostridiaceae bacterium]|jgi:CRISPR-associated endoribonuclease Cas6|nr:CRISPR system precrRNA processing endoribonuclease RAMP protein Cas6 [Clostridiaceae bacterium]
MELEVAKAQEVKSFSETEFAEKYLVTEPYATKIRITHITPCSFKSNEQYTIFPSPHLIIKSAVQKWNLYPEKYSVNDEEAIEQLIENTRIQSYNLRSTRYHVKGAVIPSFIGDTTITVRGPEPLLQLINLLMMFLEFSGLGMKTSLGMGGCKIERISR